MAFYKKFENDFIAEPNYIVSPDYELFAEEHANYTYPVDGWYWFDTEAEAREFLDIQEPPVEEQ